MLMMTVTSSSMRLAVPFSIDVFHARCVIRVKVKETAGGEEKKPDSDSELSKCGKARTTYNNDIPQP